MWICIDRFKFDCWDQTFCSFLHSLMWGNNPTWELLRGDWSLFNTPLHLYIYIYPYTYFVLYIFTLNLWMFGWATQGYSRDLFWRRCLDCTLWVIVRLKGEPLSQAQASCTLEKVFFKDLSVFDYSHPCLNSWLIKPENLFCLPEGCHMSSYSILNMCHAILLLMRNLI